MTKTDQNRPPAAPENLDSRIRMVLEENRTGIWEWNPDRNELFWNDVMFELHSFTSHLFTATSEVWDQCIYYDDLRNFKKQLAEAVRTGGKFSIKYRCNLPDGSFTYLLTKALVTGDGNTTPAKVSGVCYDVTKSHLQKQKLTSFNEELENRIALRTHDLQKAKQAALSLMQDADQQHERAQNALVELTQSRKHMEKALVQAEDANRAKSDFLATMSHEIRTPLNAIIGMTYLVMNTALDNKQQKHLSIVHEAAQSLLEIVNDILDYSKLEAGGLHLDETDFSLQDLLETTVTASREQLATKDIEFLITIDENIPANVKGDPLRTSQVLRNLLSNAVKFTAVGKVELHLKRMESGNQFSGVKIEISDTGIGMDEEQTQKLFQKFSQLDGSSTRLYGGTGLGLSICSSLLELMGGAIQVKSRPGVGTTFNVTLPLSEASDNTSIPCRTVHHSLRGLRVLLLAQESSDRLKLEQNLNSLSFEVVTSTSPQLTEKLLHEVSATRRPFELVVTDAAYLLRHSDLQVLQLDSPKMRQTALIILTSPDESPTMMRQFELRPLTTIMHNPPGRPELFEAIRVLFGIHKESNVSCDWVKSEENRSNSAQEKNYLIDCKTTMQEDEATEFENKKTIDTSLFPINRLEELEYMLEIGDMDAESLYDEIRPILLTHTSENIQHLDTAIQHLDFKKALSIIHKLIAENSN